MNTTIWDEDTAIKLKYNIDILKLIKEEADKYFTHAIEASNRVQQRAGFMLTLFLGQLLINNKPVYPGMVVWFSAISLICIGYVLFPYKRMYRGTPPNHYNHEQLTIDPWAENDLMKFYLITEIRDIQPKIDWELKRLLRKFWALRIATVGTSLVVLIRIMSYLS